MAYIQLSLWNIPAEVIVGNTLTMELREYWRTPAHYLYDWDARLRWQSMLNGMRELMTMDVQKQEENREVLKEPAPAVQSVTGSQVTFDFSLPTE